MCVLIRNAQPGAFTISYRNKYFGVEYKNTVYIYDCITPPSYCYEISRQISWIFRKPL